ncbi:c-type cytochrome [Ostreiculturibacter nitratireducens]|uniref:c-type cytochrome n=1 Tax=Ostreiculturibacter nitratireducens TaxID=3075226 RepID=UPI0031B59EF6
MRVMTNSLVAGMLLGLSAASAMAQEESVGQLEYTASCATCHGPEGKGNGTFAAFLNVEMPDLTQLAKNNGGIFPVNRVYGVIDGREEVAAHGSRYMTIWGSRYSAEMIQKLDPFGPTNKETIERMVRGRILELVFYLASIQE